MLETTWITAAGLRAACWIVEMAGMRSHRCGYVEVPQGHVLHGVGYGTQIDQISQEEANNSTVGSKSPLLAVTASCRSDAEGLIRRSPDIIFDVHGGLTFAGAGKDGYPIQSTGWWFGFDCLHYGDGRIDDDPRSSCHGEPKSQDFVISECERLASQIVAKFPFER